MNWIIQIKNRYNSYKRLLCGAIYYLKSSKFQRWKLHWIHKRLKQLKVYSKTTQHSLMTLNIYSDKESFLFTITKLPFAYGEPLAQLLRNYLKTFATIPVLVLLEICKYHEDLCVQWESFTPDINRDKRAQREARASFDRALRLIDASEQRKRKSKEYTI